jgi:bis(5'-nucleosidyl)-tetraphosphatase
MITFEKSVGAVIYRKEDKVKKYLLLHYEAGHWDFPRGHVEEGESEIETLEREVKEETGIDDLKIIPGFKKRIRYFYRAKGEEAERLKKQKKSINIMKQVIYHLAETKTKGVKISFEHTGYEWLDYESSLKKITYKNSKDVLAEADEFLTKNKQNSLF